MELGESVRTIGGECFQACSKLKEVRFPAGLTDVGAYAFASCEKLAEIHLPEGVEHLGWYAFVGCTALTSVYVPSSVSSVGYDAFHVMGAVLPNLTMYGETGSYAQKYAMKVSASAELTVE